MRIELAKILLREPDVLLLDEPTNHLDLESIESLNTGLEKFPGTVLFTSHDHKLIQTVANRIIEITPKGSIDKANTTLDDYISDDKIKKQLRELYS